MNSHNLQYNQFIIKRIWLFVHVKDEQSNIKSEKDEKKKKKMALEVYGFKGMVFLLMGISK